MNVKKAIKKRRSIRSFSDERIDYEKLENLVNMGRLAPSAANLQPVEYLIVDDPNLEKRIFEYVNWAGYISWSPSIEERPRAYIFLIVDEETQNKWYKYDVGLASENICLAALQEGLGTCILGAINREKISSLTNTPSSKRIDLAIGIGYPAQESRIDSSDKGDMEYWMDEEGNFHVPKKELNDILHHNKFE